MKTVSQILIEEQGIPKARPGSKVKCPDCGHKTLSIKHDDTLAKCFHPGCGRFFIAGKDESQCEPILHRVLDQIYHDLHNTLIEIKDSPHKNAYSYLVQERNIHPRVVADSMLGAIPIGGYNLEDKFKSSIDEINAVLEFQKNELKSKEKRKKKLKGLPAEEKLRFFLDAKEKLNSCMTGKAGWLALFYTDAFHRIVAIKFREPYAHRFLFFKPAPIGGVFNHGLFSPHEAFGDSRLDESLLVFEGEFNQLQLQSLCARIAESEGRPPEYGYVYACAVGGVDSADAETIRQLSRTPIISYDNDANKAGYELVESLRRVRTITAFTTPGIDSDMDSHIKSFKTDIKSAYQSVKDLIAGRTLFNRPYDAVLQEADAIRRMEPISLHKFEVHRQVAEIVIADLKERARFYYDGSIAYLFFDAEKLLVSIEKDNQDLELALSRYGIAPSDVIYRHMLNSVRLEAIEHGIRTKVFTFSHYDKETGSLYLYDFGQGIYQITPDRVEHVDNGTDGVLFLHNPDWLSFTFDEEKQTDCSPFVDVILSRIPFRKDILSVEDRRLLFLIWFYALFFPELFPTRPILAMIGEMGSGKTITLRKIGQLLFGPNFNVMQVSDDPKDFDAAVTHLPYVAIDNADSKKKWLEDRLAVAATGGSIKRREYFTTNKLVQFPIQAFLGITSRTPHFRRNDIADRLLIFYVDRFEEFQPEAILLSELHNRRSQIMTEVIGHLQEIIRALKDTSRTVTATRFRMADFAEFALRVGSAQGLESHVLAILDGLINEQTSFSLDDEPIVELLDLWLREQSGRNGEREVTTSILCKELAALAQTHEIEFEFQGKTRSFAQRIRNLMPSLREYFEINERKAGGRRRYLSFRLRPEHGD